MKRSIIIFFILMVLAVLSYFIYKTSTFKVFDVEINKIAEIEVPNKPYKVGVFYLPSNASSQSYIQIRQLGNEEVLQNYERYNFVNDYQLLNNTLRLVLSDTSYIDRKADTVFFKLP